MSREYVYGYKGDNDDDGDNNDNNNNNLQSVGPCGLFLRKTKLSTTWNAVVAVSKSVSLIRHICIELLPAAGRR